MKQTIITLLLVLVAMVVSCNGRNACEQQENNADTCEIIHSTEQAQTFPPAMEDTIDFVITGTTPGTDDNVLVMPYALPYEGENFPIKDGQFKVTGRLPRNTFIQIGDYADNDLRFIVEETPTHINLATGEVTGSELQKRFIRCQLREREIEKKMKPWWDSFSEEEQYRIIFMSTGKQQTQSAQDSTNLKIFEDYKHDMDAVVRQIIRENQENIIPAWYIYVHWGELTSEEAEEFMREDAPYAHHPLMERPWKVYRDKIKSE
ncbi:MAG: DUF4369 domain-containing protein [Bacteroidaceae bacterium]|nr:DUF4369 domain-containing protein [Bacteroidaceae bacterium]